ncbi:MAG TPA: hypothetical protein VF527_14740 [Pyrinomonadaceae bacterium]
MKLEIYDEDASNTSFHARHAGSRVLFLAGSVVRAEGTASSDPDPVVVYELLLNACRESFIDRGVDCCSRFPFLIFVRTFCS